jgi:hypothetical protein
VAVLCAATQLPEMTVANQYLLKTEFLKAAQMLLEAFPILTYSEDGVADLVGHTSRRA